MEYACVRAGLLGVASMLYVLPVVIRVAHACPDGAEGTTYALVMSWMNMSNVLGEVVQSAVVASLDITEQSYRHILPFLLLCVLWSLTPLCLRHCGEA